MLGFTLSSRNLLRTAPLSASRLCSFGPSPQSSSCSLLHRPKAKSASSALSSSYRAAAGTRGAPRCGSLILGAATGIQESSMDSQARGSATEAASLRGKSVGVVGAGIAGLVAASRMARMGCEVSVFDLGRGPGGRMSQRREKVELSDTAGTGRRQDSTAAEPAASALAELRFDHGAQYFSCSTPEVASLVEDLSCQGIVAEWEGRFGTWHTQSRTFEPSPARARLVGVPGMNSLCQELAKLPGVKTVFGTHVAEVEWLDHQQCWVMTSAAGEALGTFEAVVIAAAYRTFRVTVKAPSERGSPELSQLLTGTADVPADPCFALMLAFPASTLQSAVFDGAKVDGSPTISWIARDSSKPGRGPGVGPGAGLENWVVHSTAEYARTVMQSAPAGRPSPELLDRVRGEMLEGFAAVLLGPGTAVPEPVFSRVHRWGGAFPSEARAPGAKCLTGGILPVVACGDFCISPRVESAIDSALAASSWLVAKLAAGEGAKM